MNFNLQKTIKKRIYNRVYSYKTRNLRSVKRTRKEAMNQKTIPNNG